jgi:hypothetical protein
MFWRWGGFTFAGALCLGGVASCALVSGLSGLDVGEVVDASVTPDVTAIVDAPSERAVVDGGPDVPPGSDDAAAEPLRCGSDASCNVAQQTCCNTGSKFACVGQGACDASVVECNYGDQCPSGTICCMQNAIISVRISCKKATDCTGSLLNWQLCRTAAECGDGGQCSPLPNLSWLSYCK